MGFNKKIFVEGQVSTTYIGADRVALLGETDDGENCRQLVVSVDVNEDVVFDLGVLIRVSKLDARVFIERVREFLEQ